MLSKNEWDQLKTVIVGVADSAKIPPSTISLRTVNYADLAFDEYLRVKHGLYPKQVIEEANEDLEELSLFLKEMDINVLRPNKNVEPNYYNYCPRDTVLIHDELMLATPTALSSRRQEWKAMKNCLYPFGEVVRAPEPDSGHLYNSGCIGNPDVLALRDTDPCFDAANILRANDDLFYLVSNTGNKTGAEYLQRLLPDKRVHTIENVYSYIHLDSTIALLREGLLLINPSRIKNIDQLPEVLQKWDIIVAPEPHDIGHYEGYCNASKWVNVNLLSINPNLVVIEQHQHDLRRELEKYKIESAMLPMRHARTLGGCFHCVTLDLERQHSV